MILSRLHRPLVLTAALMAVLSLVFIGGLILDDRTLLGVPIYLKPLKFTVSITIYTLTLAWLISLVERGAKTARRLGHVIAAGLLIEMVAITFQAVRGHQSHFNFATTLDALVFNVMGGTIVAVWVATAWVAVLLWRQRIADRATAVAIRFGMVIALVGLADGFLMTSPSAAQIDQMSSGESPSIIGAHAVGVPDGGPGIPLVNWSSVGGDLRVGHFIGMHALQALPLFALLLAGLASRIPALRDGGVRARLTGAFALFWAGLTGVTIWQALRGQSLIHPDALTLSVLGGVVLASLLIALLGLRRRPEDTTANADRPLVGSAA